MHSTDGRTVDIRIDSSQSLSDLGSSPMAELFLEIHDQFLNLHRKLIGLTIRTPAAVRQPIDPTVLVAVVDLVACLARDPKLTTQPRHLLSIQQPGDEPKSLFHDSTLLPWHKHFLPSFRKKCYLCVRNEVLPISREGHGVLSITYNNRRLGRNDPNRRMCPDCAYFGVKRALW
jgi:hypothetical protein